VTLSSANSGVATVGHGWARAHRTSARVGRWVVRFAQIRRVFWRSRGCSRLCMSLKVQHIGLSSMNTSRKCICLLQIVYAYLASGRGSAPGPCWGLPSPRPLVPTRPPNRGYATVSKSPGFVSPLLGRGLHHSVVL